MQFERNVWISFAQTIAGRFQFFAANVLCAMQNLPLQIAQIDIVRIGKSERADAGGGEIKRRRRTEAACADAQNPRRL